MFSGFFFTERDSVIILNTIIIFLLARFLYQRKLMVFHKSLRDSKSHQVSRTLLSILADLKNAVA